MPPAQKQGSISKMEPQGKNAAKAQVGSLIAVIGDEDTVTGMLLAGIGNVDARRTSNFMVCDSKTTPGMIEEAFHRFTKRSDIAVLLVNQYIASSIRQTIDGFVSAAAAAMLPSSRAHSERGVGGLRREAPETGRECGLTRLLSRFHALKLLCPLSPLFIICVSPLAPPAPLLSRKIAGGQVAGHPGDPEQGASLRSGAGRHPPPHQAAARYPRLEGRPVHFVR